MAGNSNSKLKLLYLIKIFETKTDENNPLSALDLCKLLKRYGIASERKSVYSDIENLREFGYDIIHTYVPKNGWLLGSRKFELPEVRLLIDAVQAAGFITAKKTNILLKKLETLTSENQADEIKKQVYIDKRVKCQNEEIYYNIDLLSKAINQRKQVKFIYGRRKISDKHTRKKTERTFVVNPYALLWSNDHYYLVCNYSKYDNLMHNRIDRMKRVEILESPARNFSEVSAYRSNFDVADYAKTKFNMFTGSVESVELCCSNDILEDILDRFGEDVPIKIYNDDRFSVTVEAAVNDGLIGWIMQYGDKIKILYPSELITMFSEKLETIAGMYELKLK